MFVVERPNERPLELMAAEADVSPAGMLVLRNGAEVVAVFAAGHWSACRRWESVQAIAQRAAVDAQRGAYTGDRRAAV